MGFAPAAREDEARAAARGLEPRMRWTCPVQCWAVRSNVRDFAAVNNGGEADAISPSVPGGMQ
jgi:hypothetical protein